MSSLKSIYTIIKSPLITEKSSLGMAHRKYAFLVEMKANKIEIKRAIEKVYNVKIEEVKTMVVKGQMKRVRQNQPGVTPDWKKAIVTLKEGFEIKQA